MLKVFDSITLVVCNTCCRLTANAGRVCTRCLNGGQLFGVRKSFIIRSKQRKPTTIHAKQRKSRPHTRKYTDEQIKLVLDTYYRLKRQRAWQITKKTANEAGISMANVRTIVYYYGKSRTAPTKIENQGSGT